MIRRSLLPEKRRRKMMWLYTGFLALLAISVCLMPFGNSLKDKTAILMYLSGATFWIGLIGTIFMAVIINNSRKNSCRFNKCFGNQKQLGVIHFFQNTEATIADITMFVSIVTFIIAKIWISEIIVSFILLAICIFSFGMHCMLNGINYRYINYKVRRENEDESNKNTSC